MVFKPPTFHGKEFEPENPRTRAGLEEQVANALAEAGNVDATDVQVTLVKDTIVLTGTVLNDAERQAAIEIAASFDRVRQVDCRIRIES